MLENVVTDLGFGKFEFRQQALRRPPAGGELAGHVEAGAGVPGTQLHSHRLENFSIAAGSFGSAATK